MESKWRIFLLTTLIVSSGVEISAECYKRCHKDYIQTCNISGHRCVKTETRGYKCMPNEVIIDPCDKSPCQNGGTCTGNGAGYTCTCTQNYRGTNCEIPGCIAKFGTTKCLDGNYYDNIGTYAIYDGLHDNIFNYYFYYIEYPGGKLCGCSDICLDEGNCCHDSDCLNPPP